MSSDRSNSVKPPVEGGVAKLQVNEVTHEKIDQQDGVSALTNIDGFRILGIQPEDTAFYNSFSQERRKRLTRKASIS